MNEAQRAESFEVLDGIGDRLREERVKAGISQRELARRLGVSPSLISQLESGMSKPSVGTLYAIVTELNLSLDRVIRGDDYDETEVKEVAELGPSPMASPGDRQTIDLASGVTWEALIPETEDKVDFLIATYEVGGSSTPDQSLMRHHGREYGYIISGSLGVQIAFNEYRLEAGDSIAFDSTRPHRLYNRGDVPVKAIWVVVGRENDHRVPD